MTTQKPQQNPQEGFRTTRVMSHLRDSLVSQLKKLDPSLSPHARHSSFIERRLRDLFPAFHTPTHPPYALMIRNAILGLEEDTGSTEEAISEFIQREYSDLPWAHARILSLQLEKLCGIGEIARVSGWRYVLKVDGEVEEQCEGSQKMKKKKKKKRVKRRSNKRGQTDSAEEECKEGRLLVLGKQSQQHEEVEPQRCLRESQNQDSWLHSETTCSSQPTTLKCILAAANPLSPATCNGTSGNNLDEADKMSGSLSLNVEVGKQDKTLITEGESVLPSGDTTLAEKEPNEEKIDERCPSQPQGQGTSGGRGCRLRRNANCFNERIHPHDQAEHLMCFSHSNKKKSSSSPQSAGPNSPFNPLHNFGQQLVVPTSEGYPDCPTQVQHEVSSDIDLDRLSTRKASLTLENVNDDQSQHYNGGSSKGNLDEGPMSSDYEQKPPKRPRGRPRKLQTTENLAVVSLLPSDDGTLHVYEPNINEMEKQDQYGGDRGLGRFGRGRGKGRPPKLNKEANQRDPQDKQLGRGRGRRGRPPKLNEKPIEYEKRSQQEDQAQQHDRGRGQGRPRNLNENSVQFQEQSQQEDEGQQHGRGRGSGRPPRQQHVRARGRGRPPKPNQCTNQFEEQLQSRDQAQSVVNSPSSGRNDSQSLEQKELKVQCLARRHESDSGEAKSPAGLRMGSESKYGSDEVSQSNIEANQNVWRLQPVTRQVQGIDGCWPLRQNQK